MRKIFKRERDRASVSAQVEPNVVSLMNEIQQRLVSLEGKVDILISNSAKKPSERHFKDRDFPEGRNFTQVVCAECGATCEVPFRPSADRPVYCRDCFRKFKADNSFGGKRGRKKPFSRRRRDRGEE